MKSNRLLNELKEKIQATERVSDIEMTGSNYDDFGKLIEDKIPTITTENWEIGSYKNLIYLTFIIKSSSINNSLANLIKKFHNVQIYGFENFNKTLYPSNLKLEEINREIKKEKFFQINLNFKSIEPEKIFYQYKLITKHLKENNLEIINQLEYKF